MVSAAGLAGLVMPLCNAELVPTPSCKQGLTRAAGDATWAAGRKPRRPHVLYCWDLLLHAQGPAR